VARFAGVRRFVRFVARRLTVDRDVHDELAFHLASREDELVRSGLTPDEARELARREFGDVDAARTELRRLTRVVVRRRDRAEWLAEVAMDLRFAGRRLLREPGYFIAAVLTLGLGIGANLAIAAVGQAALLRPLPYPRPDRLVVVWETKGGAGLDRSEASYPDFEDLRTTAEPVLAGLEAFDPGNATATIGGRADRVRVTEVTPGFLDLLGARRALGRSFRPEENVPGGVPVTVLSHRYWRDAFGADPEVLGRVVTLDGTAYTVVGVVAGDFHFALGGDPDLWLPLAASAGRRAQRFNHWLRPVGRLRDGVSLATAESRLAGVMRRLAAAYPETNAGRGVVLTSLRDEIVGGVRPIVLGLGAALLMVLLIVCANLAGLTLARGLARGRELAVRTALGASRGRVVRLLLTESLLVALAGAALGALAAGPAVRLALGAVPEGTLNTLPFLAHARIAPSTLGYGLGLSLGAGLLFGAVPLVALRWSEAGALLAGGARLPGPGRGRLRSVLVVGQVALTAALLVGAGLLTRSLASLLDQDPGFVSDHVLTARIALDAPRFDSAGTRGRYLAEVVREARMLPGVRSVGGVTQLPLNGGSTNTFKVEGAPEPDPAARPEAVMRGVVGDYFETLRIPLFDGRILTPDDDRPTARSLLVNRSLADRLWPHRSAIGQRLRFYAFPDSAWEVVGVVGDVKTDALDARVPPTIYYSGIAAGDGRMSLVVETAGLPTELIPALRAMLTTLAPDVPGYSLASMDEYVARSPAIAGRRLTLIVVVALAGLGLALAVVGLYGALAYQVAQRRRELGLRMALGASPGRLRGAVLRSGTALAGLGLGLGLVLALVAGRAVRGLLYGVGATDPTTFGLVAGLLLLTGLAASWLPAYRAARVDPIETLRDD
jgi:putative ABC transport system permease protein